MIERLKAVDRRVHEALNSGRFDVIDEVCTEGIVAHDPTVPGGMVQGREAYKAYFKQLREIFPDLLTEDVLVVGEGDHIAGRMRMTGTQKGDLMGIPATGKKVSYEGSFFIRFEGEQEAEVWLYVD